jgi:ubiquinone/menaquinone biosynthesis C-methylase UbiE
MIFQVPKHKLVYTDTSSINKNYTDHMDALYSQWIKYYDGFIFFFPLWKKWIRSVLPFIKGTKLLEISFGTGFLMTDYAKNPNYEISALDYNKDMVQLAINKMKKLQREAEIIQGNVESMPYEDNSFDTIINTMAYTGYPDGRKALSEIKRVLKNDGVFLLLDYDFPKNRNIFGYYITKFIEASGDILKDIKNDLDHCGFVFEEKEIGGFGSIHRYICRKK